MRSPDRDQVRPDDAPRARRRAVVVALALGGALLVAGCGSTGPSPVPATPAAASASSATASPEGTDTAAATAAPSDVPTLTPVPGGATGDPGPAGTPIATTQTDWGTILDDVPPTFPMYPDAGVADDEGGPYSGTFDAPDAADVVAAWYRDEFTSRGYAVELSEPLEDGSQVIDAQADLPECRIQMTFRPAGGSTIITVLVAAACATGTEG